MLPNGDTPRPRFGACFLLLVWLWSALGAGAAEAKLRVFDIAAGDAAETLKHFAAQARREIIFPETVAGVRTHAVKGTFAPRAALDRMIGQTELTFVEDVRTGAFVVKRAPRPPSQPPPRSTFSDPRKSSADPPKPVKKPSLIAAIAAWFAAAPVASAQTAPAANPALPEAAIVLSPFTVNTDKDYGYQAASSITATGIGTKIRDVPVNIAVITQDFMRDRAADDLRWIANSVSGVNTNTREFTQINVRGFSAPLQVDGFDNNFVSLEGIERVEVIKGPSAVFFGTNLPGGMVNAIRAKPRLSPAHEVLGRYGTYGAYKVSASSTGPIVKDALAYRVAYSKRHQPHEYDYSSDRVEYYGADLLWQAWKKRFTLQVSVEWQEANYLRFHGDPVIHPAYRAAVLAGQVVPLTQQRTWLDNNPLYGRNEPLGQQFAGGIASPYKNYNPQGPDAGFRDYGRNLSVVGTLKITPTLDLTLQGNRNDREGDSSQLNNFRPVAGTIPGTFVFPPTRPGYSLNAAQSQSLKGRFAWQVEFLQTKHALIGGYDDYWNRTAQNNYNGPILTIDPFRDPIPMLRTLVRESNPAGVFRPSPKANRKSTVKGYYLTDQVSIFENKLRLIAGFRRTELTNSAGRSQTKATPQYAAMYTPVRMLSLYANYSETFQPNYILDAFNRQVGPTEGIGKEIGFKIGSEESRLSTTISLYRNERTNVPRRDFPNEALLGVQPLYSLGGLEANEGFEIDFFFAPTRNYQIVASYTHSWLHETISSTGEVRQVGVSLPNVPDHVVNVWNKYTFVGGPLKDVSLGGGAQFATDQQLHPSWDVPVRGPSYMQLDAFISRDWKLGGARLTTQLNLNNLTNEQNYVGSYILSDPFTVMLTMRLNF